MKLTLSYLTKNVGIVVGLVLVWRGIWHVLDWIDTHILYVFDDYKLIVAFVYIILGLLILYLPDKNLKEIQKL